VTHPHVRPMNALAPQVSVIVPSYRSRTTIEACLDSLGRQEACPSHEIIVVDSSDDGTDELIAGGFPEARLIHLPERTLPGGARNIAIAEARGELLAFTDADCVVPTDWLGRIVRRHAELDCAAIGGSVRNGRPGSAVAWAGCLVEFNEFLPRSPARPVELLPTCNVSFKRRVFERHGTFPEDLWPSEDHVFCQRLVAAGERLFFDPEITIDHLFRPGFGDFVRHQRRLGAASAAARRRVDLPNAWLVGHPLRWLVPLFRLARMESRLVRRDFPNWLRFNALLPVCVPGLVSWGLGFCLGDGASEREGASG